MVSNPGAAINDWRPFRVTAVVLVLAFALNVWTRNRLWLGYTTFGIGLLAILMALIYRNRWVLPARAVWMAGVAMALHYVGGSLSGLHQVGGPNGLYYAFPWWDNLVHFLGAWAIAVIAAAALGPIIPDRPALVVFLAASVATLAGVMVELYEFVQFVLFDTVDQGYYTNTLLDLYYNLLGAVLGAGIYVRLRSRRGAAAPSSPEAV